MIGAWVTRNGQAAAVDRKGLISGNVLVGRMDGRAACWNAEGRHRWDGVEHTLDLVERFEVAVKREAEDILAGIRWIEFPDDVRLGETA